MEVTPLSGTEDTAQRHVTLLRWLEMCGYRPTASRRPSTSCRRDMDQLIAALPFRLLSLALRFMHNNRLDDNKRKADVI